MSTPHKLSFGEKLLERLTKRPAIPTSRRTACQIEILQSEAQSLDAEATRLRDRAIAFAGRAQLTPSPTTPPPARDPLFERSEDAPPSQHETQMTAYNALLEDWRVFKLEAEGFERGFKRFEMLMGGMRKKVEMGPGKVMGANEHEFEKVENAERNLGEKRAGLEEAIREVGLPVGKGVKGKGRK
ncbi:hypothetical protein TI39_contig5869g00003 [Zymoseptoria brevis]|uniref:Uncharacterized protein n=1 Tax=Zymoseptoria brevis TaxID=1047168 RepID=A0A0F4G4R2_9PEZI|nr:hypothetical protein TI39_contig5869g00003 [Zymoseptoria brevis]